MLICSEKLELKCALLRCLRHKVHILNHHSSRFEFMKPCFGKLVVPNVTADHQWTGQRVKVIPPQGHDLYIRLLQPLRLEVSSNLYAHGLYVKSLSS